MRTYFSIGAFGSVFRGKYYPSCFQSVDVAVKTIKSKFTLFFYSAF